LNRAYYSNRIPAFLSESRDEILGILLKKSAFSVEQTQRDAWLKEIDILKKVLVNRTGSIYFEFSIPRMGRRVDVILIIGGAVFVLEFKIGESRFDTSAVDQVMDYALDLKNFHATSHPVYIAPILIATGAAEVQIEVSATPQNDKILDPLKINAHQLGIVLESVLDFIDDKNIDNVAWERGQYRPTPTIIEAALALYNGHAVSEITRSDATATNLTTTSEAILKIVRMAKANSKKVICFVTGVPGAGKTLVGLNIATKNIDKLNDLYSVYLSGNGPLVDILREVLARDKVKRTKEQGKKIKKGVAFSEVKTFIQNVHHFRDECLLDESKPPFEHVAIFDEAQRAWNLEQTRKFMLSKKGKADFNQSESEFLISCLNRHRDWAVVICLVGGGQEINSGEAGISEWMKPLFKSFRHWHVYMSSRLSESDYATKETLTDLIRRPNTHVKEELHLSVSLRSFRAEYLSNLISQVLDLNIVEARKTYTSIRNRYPIVVTRNLDHAKRWLRNNARGSERYGIVVSSSAERLKPHAIYVKAPMDPIHWFLDGKEDVRSSFYLEDVATEFHIQGLELDWACVTWDADLRYSSEGWQYWSFQGSKWSHVRKPERQKYLKNAYRVLLTRARQGVVIVVPHGDSNDHTRNPKYYDSTFEYLKSIGLEEI